MAPAPESKYDYVVMFRALEGEAISHYGIKVNQKFIPEELMRLLSSAFARVDVMLSYPYAPNNYFDPMYFLARFQEKLFQGIDTLSKREKRELREKVTALKKANDYMLDTCRDIERTDYAEYKRKREKGEETSNYDGIVGDSYGVQPVSTSSVTASAVYWDNSFTQGVGGHADAAISDGSGIVVGDWDFYDDDVVERALRGEIGDVVN